MQNYETKTRPGNEPAAEPKSLYAAEPAPRDTSYEPAPDWRRFILVDNGGCGISALND